MEDAKVIRAFPEREVLLQKINLSVGPEPMHFVDGQNRWPAHTTPRGLTEPPSRGTSTWLKDRNLGVCVSACVCVCGVHVGVVIVCLPACLSHCVPAHACLSVDLPVFPLRLT